MTDEELSLFRKLVENTDKILAAMTKPTSPIDKMLVAVGIGSGAGTLLGIIDILARWLFGG